MNPLRCRCGNVIDERTDEPIHPERVECCAGWTCPGCIEKSNAATLAAWRKLSPMEREGARTREERGA